MGLGEKREESGCGDSQGEFWGTSLHRGLATGYGLGPRRARNTQGDLALQVAVSTLLTQHDRFAGVSRLMKSLPPVEVLLILGWHRRTGGLVNALKGLKRARKTVVCIAFSWLPVVSSKNMVQPWYNGLVQSQS